MINLLPPQQVEELREKEKVKIIINILFFFLTFFIFLSLIFLAIRFYFLGVLSEKEILLKEREKLLDPDLEKEIKEINETILKINSFLKNQPSFSSIIQDFVASCPSGIKLTNLDLSFDEKKGILITANGIAETRLIILQLIKTLKEKYQDVSYSPEILLKEKNVEFSFSFRLK